MFTPDPHLTVTGLIQNVIAYINALQKVLLGDRVLTGGTHRGAGSYNNHSSIPL